VLYNSKNKSIIVYFLNQVVTDATGYQKFATFKTLTLFNSQTH